MSRAVATLALACFAAAAVAGCAPGKSIVTVTVDAAAPIGTVASLTVTPSDSAGHKDTITVPVNDTIPPAYTFSLRFDASVKTTVHIAVTALDNNNAVIGTAAGDVTVKPSATATLPLTLAPPMGTTLAFTMQPSNAAVGQPINPSVVVSIKDDNGNTVARDGIDITVALGTNPSNAKLGGTLTQPTTRGEAVFADLTVDSFGNGYTLVASATDLTSATSMPFDVTPPVWVPKTNGIFGGAVNWVAFDPANGANAYAATNGGVFKSTDGGASWTSINAGLVSRLVSVVAVDPFNPMRLLAGTSAGMFVTTNGGTSWTAANGGFDPTVETPTRIFFEPATANTVWMATQKPNVYVSAGATVSWDSRSNASWPGLPSARATGLGVDAAGNVYVSTFNNVGGMWKLATGATMWTQIGNPIPTNYLDSMVVDRASTPNVIWVGTDNIGGAGIFKGNGTTFAASSTGLPLTFVEGIGVAASNPQVVYVVGSGGAMDPFVFKTTNGGGNWAPAATGLPTTSDFRQMQTTIAVDPTDPNHVLCPSPSSLYRTTNGGSWAASNTGMTGWPINALATKAGTAGLVVAGTAGGGIFLTTDNGGTWAPEATNDKNVLALVAANSKLYAGTTSGVLTSTDGVTWTPVPSTNQSRGLVAAPSNPMIMYAANNTIVSVSSDGGATWGTTAGTLAGAMAVQAFAVDPTNPMTVYAGTLGTGVYRSGNGGGSWGATNSGLTNLFVRAMAATASTVFAGSDGGIFRSTDGGSSWTLAGGSAGVSVSSFALHPTRPEILYAGSSSGVLQSTDGGATWKPYNAGLGDTQSGVVLVDSNDPNVVWAGTASAGVYVARP